MLCSGSLQLRYVWQVPCICYCIELCIQGNVLATFVLFIFVKFVKQEYSTYLSRFSNNVMKVLVIIMWVLSIADWPTDEKGRLADCKKTEYSAKPKQCFYIKLFVFNNVLLLEGEEAYTRTASSLWVEEVCHVSLVTVDGSRISSSHDVSLLRFEKSTADLRITIKTSYVPI